MTLTRRSPLSSKTEKRIFVHISLTTYFFFYDDNNRASKGTITVNGYGAGATFYDNDSLLVSRL